MEMETSETEVVAALLHDVIEDGGGPTARDEIKDQFGPEVCSIVVACSDTLDKEHETRTWLQRKRDYLAAMPSKSAQALRVSLADKVHNARSIHRDLELVGDNLWCRFKANKACQHWHYYALASGFTQRTDLGAQADVAVGELSSLVSEIWGPSTPRTPLDDDDCRKPDHRY
jgi:GTP pyrophosphokinase